MQTDFLSLHPSAFGLDLSDLSIKIAKLKKTNQKFVLASFCDFAIPEGYIEQGEIKKEDQLAEILRKAVSQTQGEALNTKYAVVSLPEEKAFLRVIQLPIMKPEEVRSAVSFELENYIPYSPETVYIDTQIVPPIKNHIDHMDVLLAALPRATVDSYVSLMRKADLIPQVFEIESLACARAIMQNGISPFPVLLIDLGATRTSFIVFAGYSLRFTASILVSSSQFTKSIGKTLNVDARKAEELKIRYGLCNQESAEGKQVFEAMVPPLVDLVEQIKKYMDYYEVHASHQHLTIQEMKVKKIFLTGGGANLQGMSDFLERELKTEVAFGNPWVNILPQPVRELPPLPFDASIQYTTALGLALRSFAHD